MAPKCRAGPPAGAQARITGFARSALGGPRLSFDDILWRAALSAPDGYVVASLGGVLFTFEPSSVFRFVPQGEVDAMRTGTPPRERPDSPPKSRGRGRLRSPLRPPARSAPRSMRSPRPRPTAEKVSKPTSERSRTSASTVPPAHQDLPEDECANDHTAGEPVIDSIEAPGVVGQPRRRVRRRKGRAPS